LSRVCQEKVEINTATYAPIIINHKTIAIIKNRIILTVYTDSFSLSSEKTP